MVSFFSLFYSTVRTQGETQAPIGESLQKALEAQQKGEMELAESYYRFSLAASLDQLGDTYFKSGKYDLAEQAYEQGLQSAPFFELLLIDLAYSRLYGGSFQKGIEAVEALLGVAPAPASYVSALGQLEKLKESITDFQAPARHLLGKLQIRAKHYDQAVTELERARQLTPEDSGLIFTLALAYLKRQQLSKAEQIFAHLLATVGDSPRLRVALGRAYLEGGFTERAIQEFSRTGEQEKAGYYYLGLAYLEQQNIKESVHALKKALLHDPNHYYTEFYLGFALALLGNLTEATHHWNHCISLDPENPLPYVLLGYLSFQANHSREATIRLKKANSLLKKRKSASGNTPEQPDLQLAATAHYLIGRALLREDPASDEGRLHLETVVGLLPDAQLDSSNLQKPLFSSETLRWILRVGTTPLILERQIPDKGQREDLIKKSEIYKALAAKSSRSLALLASDREDFSLAQKYWARSRSWDVSTPGLQDRLDSLGLRTPVELLKVPQAATSTQKQMAHILLQARTAFIEGDYGRSATILNEVIKGDRFGQAQRTFLLGLILQARNQFQEAEKSFLRALTLEPAWDAAYVNLAKLYRKENRLEEALNLLLKASELLPDSSSIALNLAGLYLDRDEPERSISWLSKIRPENAAADYFLLLAKAQAAAGRSVQAEQTCLSGLKIHPDSVSILNLLAQVALEQGRFAGALEFMSRARGLAPFSPHILFSFSYLSLRAGAREQGIAVLRRLRIMEPDNADYLMTLGQALTLRRDSSELAEAIQCFQRYVELRPHVADGHGFLGYCAFLIRDYELAEKHLVRSAELRPDQTAAYYYQGIIAYERGEDARTRELLLHVLRKEPNHGMAHLAMGRLLYRGREFEEAVSELEKAAALVPNSPEIYYQLSLVYRQIGQSEKSKQALETYERLKAKGQQPPALPALEQKPL